MSADAVLAGGFGGVCLTLVGAPFDLVKVRQQAEPGSSAIRIVRSVVAAEGLRGLFRGVGPPLAAAIPSWALVFWSFDLSRQLVRQWHGKSANVTTTEDLAEVAQAGALVAIPTSFMYTPVDRIKSLYQVDGARVAAGQPALYKSVPACVSAVWREGGLRALFRGFWATLARDVPAWAVYFSAYCWAKQQFAARAAAGGSGDGGSAAVLDGRASFAPTASLLAGGLAGMSTWAVAIPFDNVKTWRQTGTEATYLQACRTRLARGGGVRALFAGFFTIVLGGLPRDAACLCGAEAAHRALTLGRTVSSVDRTRKSQSGSAGCVA